MGKTYHYRKHVRWCKYAFTIFLAVMAVALCVGAILVSQLVETLAGWETLLSFSSYCLCCSALAIFSWIFFGRLASVGVSIDDDCLVYDSSHAHVTIALEQITRLTFPSIRYVGGWVKVVSQERNIRLTVVLEGIAEFLQELKAALDRKGLQDRYDRRAFFRFLKTAAISDQSWERLYSIFWKGALLSVLTALMGYALAGLNGTGVLGKVWWTAISFYWPTVVFIVTEVAFARRLAKEADEEPFTFPPRDVTYERAVYRGAVWWGCLTYCLAAPALLAISRFLL